MLQQKDTFGCYCKGVPLNQTRLHMDKKKSWISINKQNSTKHLYKFNSVADFFLVNNAINPKISRARGIPSPMLFSSLPMPMIYHFSFILLKTRSRFFRGFNKRELLGKLDSPLGHSENDAFFGRKNIPFHKENTQKKSTFCDPLWSEIFSFVALVKKNKYWGSLNLWTIYILCVIFCLVGDLSLFASWWFYWAGLCCSFRASLIFVTDF